MNDEIWSFNWVAVDAKGCIEGPFRVYSDALANEPADTARLLDLSERIRVIQRNLGEVALVVRRESRYCFSLHTSHRIFGSKELRQLTFVQHPEGEGAADDWQTFLREIEPLTTSSQIEALGEIWARDDVHPVAFTVRAFEGLMPEVEMIHHAFAAVILRRRLNLNLPPPAWADSDAED